MFRQLLPKILSQLAFVGLMAVILPASLAVIVCLYLPFVAIKALGLMALGRVKPRFLQTPEERARADRDSPAPSGPMPF